MASSQTGASDGAAFKEKFESQAKVLAVAVKGKTGGRTSTIRILPTYKPPSLGDDQPIILSQLPLFSDVVLVFVQNSFGSLFPILQ